MVTRTFFGQKSVQSLLEDIASYDSLVLGCQICVPSKQNPLVGIYFKFYHW